MRLLILLMLLLSPALYGKQRDSKAAATEKKARSTAQQREVKSTEEPQRLVIGSVERWQAQAEQRFPQLRQVDSEFRAEFLSAQKAMREKNPEFFLANDWPVRLAEAVARSLKSGQSVPLAAIRQ